MALRRVTAMKSLARKSGGLSKRVTVMKTASMKKRSTALKRIKVVGSMKKSSSMKRTPAMRKTSMKKSASMRKKSTSMKKSSSMKKQKGQGILTMRPTSRGQAALQRKVAQSLKRSLDKKALKQESGMEVDEDGKKKRSRSPPLPKAHSFEVTYAKSDRSRCRVCRKLIAKGELRFGHLESMDLPDELVMAEMGSSTKSKAEVDRIRSDFYRSSAEGWHHYKCFPKMKSLKWFQKNYVEGAAEMHVKGMSSLTGADRKAVNYLWKLMQSCASNALTSFTRKGANAEASAELRLVVEGKPSSPTLTPASSPRKSPGGGPSSSSGGSRRPGSALTKDEERDIVSTEKELMHAKKTNFQLQHMLRKNGLPVTGSKHDLIHRVAEGQVLGILPKCPLCGEGFLNFAPESGQVFCRGFFDNSIGFVRRCAWKGQERGREVVEEVKKGSKAMKIGPFENKEGREVTQVVSRKAWHSP